MKLFIITGISRGLGEQLVTQLTQHKQRIIGIGRTFTREQNILATSNSNLLTLIGFDLANTLSFNELKIELDSKINDNAIEVIFVNNAGIVNPISKVGNIKEDADVERHINVNYLMPVLLTNYLLNKHRGPMKILNISSGAAEASIEGWSLYCSSKKAIKTFLDVVNKENMQLTVEHIDPGVMNTRMQKNIRECSVEDFPTLNHFRGLKNNNKLMSPEDVARKIIKGYLIK
ncbi:SDR family NAD(P)-dependent oxidoreductase [Sporosarcina sp. ANT_H38]|uniref:SDR family NAD(P)-dependent oxidoreductase n=1 Tax=Sporosarcina sp. ANT_H38 TaxID=2597358 RepID=UPI00165E8D74|nr:SDR family NAD(P)-dependent oxidoreductase [Sporosarcina sp. ANT_H38]